VGAGAPPGARGAQQVVLDLAAVGVEGLVALGEVDAGAIDQRARRRAADAQLRGDVGVRGAVDLAAQERVALLLGQRGDALEHAADAGAALVDLSGAVDVDQRHQRRRRVERDRVGLDAADLIERAVARELGQPRAEQDHAVVAQQRLVGAHERPLHDVLGRVRTAAQDAPREAQQARAVAGHDRVEGALVAGAQALDEARVLVTGIRDRRQQHQQRSPA
jgi:hypothetical protein